MFRWGKVQEVLLVYIFSLTREKELDNNKISTTHKFTRKITVLTIYLHIVRALQYLVQASY